MLKKRNVVWKLYFLLFCCLCVLRAIEIFSARSPVHNFYHILMAFDISLIIHYLLSVLTFIVMLLSAVPLYLFAFEKTVNDKAIFQRLFVTRVVVDLLNHRYEWLFIKSFLREDLWIGLSCIGIVVLPLIPSYIAHYLFAFRRPRTLFD